MLLSTPLPPVLSSPLATSTTSVTLVTDTRPSSTVQQTHPWADNSRANRILRQRRATSGRGSRRMITGSTGTRPRKTEWDADAVATPISWTSRARRVAAWRSGWTWPADGLALRAPSEQQLRNHNRETATRWLWVHEENGHEEGMGRPRKTGGNDGMDIATTKPEISAL